MFMRMLCFHEVARSGARSVSKNSENKSCMGVRALHGVSKNQRLAWGVLVDDKTVMKLLHCHETAPLS